MHGTGIDAIDLQACFDFVEELRSDTGTLQFHI
jgi:hypothetical protein